MNYFRKENIKSLALGSAAIVLLGLWMILMPEDPVVRPEERIGQRLFPNFENATQAGSITIVKRGKGEDRPSRMRLESREGKWCLASHLAFPAENATQMAKVLTPLLHLTVLGVRNELGAEPDTRKIENFHAECGLIDPGDEAVKDPEKTGVRVSIGGRGGETFVDVVVGKRLEESSADRDVRYLRIPGEPTVYTADFSTKATDENQDQFETFVNALSVDPLDWVDRDILRISRWDIRSLDIHDYPYDVKTKKGTLRGRFVLEQDPTNSLQRAWKCDRYYEVDKNGKYEKKSGLPPEKIQNDRINEAADALSRLRLSGFVRKSEPLSRVLRDGTSIRPWVLSGESLDAFGFGVADFDVLNPEKTEPVFVGEAGECRLNMKDGVQLTIVFGARKGTSRFLLVFAGFDENNLSVKKPIEKKDVPANASADEKARIHEENQRIESENRLRKNEFELARSEGMKKADEIAKRMAPWFFLVEDEDLKNVILHSRNILK